MSRFNSSLYSNIIKPVCFSFDPEKTHDFFLLLGKMIESNQFSRSLLRSYLSYGNPVLKQDMHGISFNNPVGLSAGFDKSAELIPVIGDVGFGFTEVGSITAKPCPGNEGKRLIRLPDKQALWVNFGLNNAGADSISSRLHGKAFDIPVGINVAKTNCRETVDSSIAIKDYVYTLQKFNELDIGDYFTINISCPNAYGGQPFSDPASYSQLMEEISKLNINKPILVKLSPDLDKKTLDSILSISRKRRIAGFVCSNLTKKNTGFDKGGVSGKMVSPKSEELLSYVYKSTRSWKQKPVLIGVGGIFSAEDAYRKIKLGANLVQLITGMIYNGPSVIGDINRGLVDLLEKDGFSSISEAVGSFYSE
jgi:dihydroorotate dehydrogenase